MCLFNLIMDQSGESTRTVNSVADLLQLRATSEYKYFPSGFISVQNQNNICSYNLSFLVVILFGSSITY